MSPEQVLLRSGHTVWVRPVLGTDSVGLQTVVSTMSELSRYQRFLTGTVALSDRVAAYFSEVDHHAHEALVALRRADGDEIVGVARYVRHPDATTEADLALAVVDEWHERGLATALLARLAERARQEGVRRFRVDVLADNTAVLALLRRSGLVVDDTDGQIVIGHLDLGAGSP
jgi:RimJ/RimL family protein N-acetyltransferase